ncbi:hypothetical protein, partial [Escherichia coli]|uniref:hypothetical protein n=2 Tax=Escherichia coli TaxID=562 RepID=UPI001BC89E85
SDAEKIKSAPPPARSAFPASPARFMGWFECSCMTVLDPRPFCRCSARTDTSCACKTMHLLHARLKNREITVKQHKKTGTNGADLKNNQEDVI